jgi:hypothetical protein
MRTDSDNQSVATRTSSWVWVWVPLALFLTGVGWALTSPVGSSPDDDYHLSSIWCSAEDSTGACVLLGDGSAGIAMNIAQAHSCYAFRPEVNAGCTLTASENESLVVTRRVNQIEGFYPSSYYGVMSLLVSEDVERSVLVMRLLNVGIASLLLALLLRIVPRGVAFATSAALVVSFMPMGLFLLPSTNPSSWVSSGILLFWGFAVALLHQRSWRSTRTWLMAGGAAAAVAMAVSARVDAAAYVVVTCVVVFLLAGWRTVRVNIGSSLFLVILGIVGACSYLSFPTPGGGEEGLMGTADRGLDLLFTNFGYLPTTLRGIVGDGALGWNDTLMVPLVPMVGVLVVGAMAWAGLSTMWTRKAWAASFALVSLYVIPLWFLQKEGLTTEEVIQPRYLLPLLSLLVATLLLGRSVQVPIVMPRLPLIWVAGGLSVAGILAFWSNAHRYAAGTNVGIFDFGFEPAWTNSAGVPLWVSTAIVVVGTCVAMWGALITMSGSERSRHESTLMRSSRPQSV